MRIGISLLLITILTGSVVGSTGAYFSDTETSNDNQFVAGEIDLKVNGQDNPGPVVTLNDLKPGDLQTVNKSLIVNTNPAEVFLHIKDWVSDQGQQTEPEELEESGSPKHDLENYVGYGLSVNGNDIISATESGVLLREASSCYIPLGIIEPNVTIPMQQFFSLPASVTNWAQGDTLTFSEDFFAQQARHNPIDPETGSGRIWNPDLKKCEECTFITPVWLSENITSSFGNRKNGSSVVATRKNPSNALGVNNGNAEGTFVSLGYGGEMVYKFPVVVANGAGDDLKFYEVTNGRNTYPTETATVQISQDGTNWFPVVGYTITSEPGGDGIIFVEVSSSGLTQFQYVKIKDTTNAALNPDGLSDGYDLDAVQAMYGKACSS